ncbi:MAG: PEP-CTERM sorting domain-containing protein [Planctomycetaceae bacterium]|nr:PEP-CTERM sorting domain-containing protein [Planctomycetaceae bacterium]
MRKTFFALPAVLFFAFAAVTFADVISLRTGTPVKSQYHPDGKNVTGTVSDYDHNGYADGRAGSSGIFEDPTNTRDKNWSVIYTDVFKSEYKEWAKKSDSTKINARLSAVEYELSKLGSGTFGYVDTWKDYGAAGAAKQYVGSTGVKAAGVVYGSTADLFAQDGIGMTAGGLSNFAVNGAGVLTTYGGGYFDEAGQYHYNKDKSIDYIGHDDLKTDGFTGVQSGLAAFTTGFEMATGFNYINGTFAILGELMGIYLNGTLLDDNLYHLSKNTDGLSYAYDGRYDLEIDLTNDFIASLLKNGNNNLSFAVLGVPHDIAGVDSFLYNDSMSFINISADIMQNTESTWGKGGDNTNPVVPEPATMLIFGIGLTGLALRRQFVRKKNETTITTLNSDLNS